MINKQFYIDSDTYVSSAYPSSNLNEAYVRAGYYNSHLYRGLMKSSTIPTTSNIVSDLDVEFCFYVLETGSGYKSWQYVTSNWNESTVTWNTKPTYTTVYNNTAYNLTGWTSFNGSYVDSLVEDWIDGTKPNYGLAITEGTFSIGTSNLQINDRESLSQNAYFLINGTFGTESTSYAPIEDTYIDEAFVNTNYSSSTSCTMGEDLNGKDQYYMFKIDSSLVSSISPLYQAQIRIYVSAKTIELGEPIEIYKITSNWTNSTVTWNTRPTMAKVASFYTGSNTGQLNPTVGSWLSIDITDVIQDWLDGDTNYGIAIFHNGTTSDEITFNSLDNASNKPYLYLDYDISTVTVESPSATATTTTGTPTQSNAINLEPITALGAQNIVSTILRIKPSPVISSATATIPALKASVLVESESMTAITEFRLPIIRGSSTIESSSIIGTTTFGVPKVSALEIIEPPSMTAITLSATPSLYITEKLYIDGDSWLDSRVGNEDNTNGNDTSLDLYYSSTPLSYPILKINDLSNYIGKDYDNVSLFIYIDSQNSLNMLSQITIDIVDSDWSENTVSWTNKPTYGSIQLAATPVPTDITGWYEIPIDEIFDDWIDNANYGLIMYGSE